MGAWGHGSFENDGALDWSAALAQAPSLAEVRRTLQRAARPRRAPLDLDDASAALAAAEVVAALGGSSGGGIGAALLGWVAGLGAQPTPALVALAVRAVDQVEAHSELAALWDEPGRHAGWHGAVQDLRARLLAPRPRWRAAPGGPGVPGARSASSPP